MRVALLEVSHWHVPLYLDALEAPGIEVVAVSDAEKVKGEAIAARFGTGCTRRPMNCSNVRKSILPSCSGGILKCRRLPRP